MNKIKTRRSPGTKILGVPGIKEMKVSQYSKKNCCGLNKRGKNKFRS